MSIPKLKSDQKFTYEDYKTWPEDERWELIDGRAYDMSPAPGTDHQEIIGLIFRIIADYLDGKKCRVFLSPLDVLLNEKPESADKKITTVVQPDILVVCDESKITKKGILGPPDIAIEVLSESTAYKDETQKLFLYEKHGVKEYWIVNPEAHYINIFRLEANEKFAKPVHYRKGDAVESSVLTGMKFDCTKIFPDQGRPMQ